MLIIQPAHRVKYRPEERAYVHEAVDRIMDTGMVTNNEYVGRLQAYWAGRTGLSAVAVMSCTMGLEMLLRFAEVGGGQVITQDNTFVGTLNAIHKAGAQTRLCDVSTEQGVLGVRLEDIQAAYDPNMTKAVIVVHMLGWITPHMDKIAAWCKEKEIALIEDCAQAHGADLNGRQPGSWGIGGVLSYSTIKLVTGGEGGMLLTNNEEVVRFARLWREWGKMGEMGWLPGYTGKLSEFNAAAIMAKSLTLDQEIAERAVIASRYREALPMFEEFQGASTPNHYRYAAWLPEGISRLRMRWWLRHVWGMDLPRVINSDPIHRQPVWIKHYGGPLQDEDFPGSSRWSDKQIDLPIYTLSDREFDYIVEAVRDAHQAAMNDTKWSHFNRSTDASEIRRF